MSVRTEGASDTPGRRWELYHGNGESWNPLPRPRDRVGRRVCACIAAHLPVPTGGVHWEGASRCNCVNCTTHMIRIAFNYSSTCEILSQYPLSRSSPVPPSPVFPAAGAHWRGVRAHSMVMRDERKGKRWTQETPRSPESKTRDFNETPDFYSSSRRNTKLFDLPKYLSGGNRVVCDAKLIFLSPFLFL